MTRGRKRKFDPTIPSHIDQAKLPNGIYWKRSRRYWYVRLMKDGRASTLTVAGAGATLSELHAIAESRHESTKRDLDWLANEFTKSPHFLSLGAATQASYGYSRKAICELVLKSGARLGSLDPKRLTRPFWQRVIDMLSAGRPNAEGAIVPMPAKGRAAKSYSSVLFSWAANRGYMVQNIAQGVETQREKRQHGMPTRDAHERLISWIKSRTRSEGRRAAPGERHSFPGYLWPAMEIAYLCRLRRSELVMLTDASCIPELGLYAERLKGSEPTLTHWNARLESAVAALKDYRKAVRARNKNEVNIFGASRPLFVNLSGEPLTSAALSDAWKKCRSAAVAQGVIPAGMKLHGLKHRGITDTPGDRAAKQQAAGHRTPAMTAVYDHDVAYVEPAQPSERLEKVDKIR